MDGWYLYLATCLDGLDLGVWLLAVNEVYENLEGAPELLTFHDFCGVFKADDAYDLEEASGRVIRWSFLVSWDLTVSLNRDTFGLI